MRFDIRNQQLAQETLYRITSVPYPKWKEETDSNYNRFEYVEDFLENVIEKHGRINCSYDQLEFVFSHLTSSANECKSIRECGLQDLSDVCAFEHSELIEFLLCYGIEISPESALLRYGGREYDISVGRFSPLDSEEVQKCKRIGYRLYSDYCVCGFLSIDPNRPYLTRVDKQPEILIDIGDLIGKALDQKWAFTHQSYEVVAKVDSIKVRCDSEQPTDKGKLLCYLSYAFWNALGDQDERLLLCQDGITIPCEDILEIRPFSLWQ